MDFMTAGTLQGYTKTLALQTRWNLKRSSGDVNAHTKSLGGMLAKTPAAATAQQQIDEQRENGSDKLKDIMEKVYAGKKLTRDEKEYLKAKNPAAYAQIESANQEQKAYERALKRCRTKEDVQRAKALRTGAALTRVNAVLHDPAISQEKKLEAIGIEKYRLEKLNESERAFVKRGEYGKLPTDAEKSRAEKEEREAEALRLAKPDKPETESARGADEPDEALPDSAESGRGAENGRGETAAQSGQSATRTESEVARKVKRAKRRAAEAAYNWTADPLPTIQAEA